MSETYKDKYNKIVDRIKNENPKWGTSTVVAIASTDFKNEVFVPVMGKHGVRNIKCGQVDLMVLLMELVDENNNTH